MVLRGFGDLGVSNSSCGVGSDRRRESEREEDKSFLQKEVKFFSCKSGINWEMERILNSVCV